MKRTLNRRSFLRTSAAGAAYLLAARSARPSDVNSKLRVAAIGTGNKGRGNLDQIAASSRVEIAALCNVDHSKRHLGWAVEKFPQAAVFADYRRLLEKPDSFDAVIVSTPDHMHAPIALAAMELGKHVFCEKPLTHTVSEARAMREAAERGKLVTQMGNQIQSRAVYRNAVQLVHDGAIGKVREVHSWQSGEIVWKVADLAALQESPPPERLNWDLWLGVAPERPYRRRVYHPKNWRAWQDFGTGQLGDFGCHLLDPVVRALELGPPISVEAENEPFGDQLWSNGCKVVFRFSGTVRTSGDLITLTWYDGEGHRPDRAALGLPDKYELPEAGSVLLGDDGTLVIPHVAEAQLFPEEKFKDYARPKLEDVNHYTGWVDACLDGSKTTSNFTYAGPLTEAVLLGVVATRFPGEQLTWDASAGQFVHHADANARLSTVYRAGWT